MVELTLVSAAVMVGALLDHRGVLLHADAARSSSPGGRTSAGTPLALGVVAAVLN